ncbi:protein IWS1 homolog isoform X2 [Conger conger]|uniref:protein IWS1 homolog isoform X2 n=1 Tax=Conger conger TaxID=82655 RepID=UPI002A5AFD42|nr:protein IWS1 homolog isoform X2 [Conger conger]
MDGEDDEFFSGNHSDDGGGTPVQDEHAPASDGEEDARSDAHQSEGGLSEGEGDAQAGQANGIGSASENEDARGLGDSDSEKDVGHDSDSDMEAPKPADSDSEQEAPKPANSDSEDEAPKPVDSDSEPEAPKPAESDSEDEPPKPANSDSEPEAPKFADSDSEQEAPKPADSDAEEEAGPKQGGSASENEEQTKPIRGHSDAGSNSENDTPKQRRQLESDEDDGVQEKDQGNWKGVMHSDSEEEGGPARAGGSDQPEGGKRQQLDDSEEEKPVKRKKAILSDSEDDDEKDAPVTKKSRALVDAENSDSDAASGSPDKSLAAKLRELGSDSEEEDDRTKGDEGKKDEKNLFGSDSDSDDEEEKMIADIFGESGDEEEEEFTGFNQADLEGDRSQSESSAKKQVAEDTDSDDDIDRSGKDTSFMSDFDVMLARKKAQSGRRRRNRDGGTFISDADDVVSAMIIKMTEAAEEDRTLNSQKKPALKKLTLLPTVVMHLKKQDLKETFIDSGVMSAIKEWISPLPDKSLPALKIREELLKILQELPSVSQETLKHSGIGRAVMFLYKHPKESRPNKDVALKLINEWSRPIFGLTSNYKGMTREERQQRDLDQQVPPRRRLSEQPKVERSEEPDVFSSPTSSGGQTPRRDLEKVLTGEEKALRPGDPGFCARARVPMPSNKDYVVRPKWNVDGDTNRSCWKKGMNRLEKHKRRIAEQRKLRRLQGAVKISVEGNHMPL